MTLLNAIQECGCYVPWWMPYLAFTLLIGGPIWLLIDFVRTWPKDEDDEDIELVEKHKQELEMMRRKIDYMKGIGPEYIPKPNVLQMELYQLTEKSA